MKFTLLEMDVAEANVGVGRFRIGGLGFFIEGHRGWQVWFRSESVDVSQTDVSLRKLRDSGVVLRGARILLPRNFDRFAISFYRFFKQ